MAGDTSNVISIEEATRLRHSDESVVSAGSPRTTEHYSRSIKDASTPDPEGPGEIADVEELYRPTAEESPVLRRALDLLDELEEHVSSAHALASSGDSIGADDEIQHTRAVLRELFCCRSLGDGFALLVSSTMIGIQHRGGEPLDEMQIAAIKQAAVNLRRMPFLSFEAALDERALLEDVGLIVSPDGLDGLVDEPNDSAD